MPSGIISHILLLEMFSCGRLFHFFIGITNFMARFSVCARHPNPMIFNITAGISIRWGIISTGCTALASSVQDNFSILGAASLSSGNEVPRSGKARPSNVHWVEPTAHSFPWGASRWVNPLVRSKCYAEESLLFVVITTTIHLVFYYVLLCSQIVT